MKQLILSWKQSLLALAVVATAGLSSCNRAEYAMLPKTSSYHGTERVAAKPVAAPIAATPAPAEAVVATAPVAAPAAPAAVAVAKPAPAKAAKPSLLQKALVNKVLKKADKVAGKLVVKKHSETAKASKLEGKLRQGVILLILGIVLEVVGAALGLGVISLLGWLIALVGLVLIVLYLLDSL